MRIAAFFVVAAALAAPVVVEAAPAAAASPPAAADTQGVPATGATAEELFTRFDLFGIWAVDCKGKASPANPHVTVSNPGPGLVFEDHDLGAGYAVNRYSVEAAQALSRTRLSVEVIFQPGKKAEERQTLIFQVRDRRRRTLFNQAAGGAVRVKDGIALARGTRTPVLRKCG